MELRGGKFHADQFWKYTGPNDYAKSEQAAANQSGMSVPEYRRTAANAEKKKPAATLSHGGQSLGQTFNRAGIEPLCDLHRLRKVTGCITAHDRDSADRCLANSSMPANEPISKNRLNTSYAASRPPSPSAAGW